MAQGYSDSELIQMIKENNSVLAFNELVKKYQNRALGLAYAWVENRHDAEDIAQEAFIRVYKSLDRFRETADFFTWFYKIIINLCRDFHRAKKGISLLHLGSYSKEEADEQHIPIEKIETETAKKSTSNNPARIVINRELNQKITEAIKLLPDKQRIAFTLKHLEGLTIKEISKIMECAEGTVKTHLWRAVNMLRGLLKPYVT